MERDLPAAILAVARDLDTPPRALSRDAFASHDLGWKPKRYTEAKEKAQRQWEAGDGRGFGKVTTHTGKDGEVKNTWTRSHEEEGSIRAAGWLLDKLQHVAPLPLTKPRVAPPSEAEDLMAAILLGDNHMGLYCSELVGGIQWDRKRAIETTMDAIDELVTTGTPASHGLLVDVGDYLHAADLLGRTVKGTPLDTDGLMYEAIDDHALKVYMVQRMLEHHDHVTVISQQGNHEGIAQYHLALALRERFRDEPRVTVVPNAEKINVFQWGACLFPITHGDSIKGSDLGSCLVNDPRHRPLLANAKKIHGFIGHYHHKKIVPLYSGDGAISYEQVAVLPPADKWHRDHGFFGAERAMERIVFHRNGKEKSRNKFTV